MKENNFKCVIECVYKSRDIAESVEKALQPDNIGFVKTIVKGNKLVAIMYAKNCLSLLHTINDFLTCTATAENVSTLGANKSKNLRSLKRQD